MRLIEHTKMELEAAQKQEKLTTEQQEKKDDVERLKEIKHTMFM